MQGEIQPCSREFATLVQSIGASENAGLIWVTKTLCLWMVPPLAAECKKIINQQSRAAEKRRKSDAEKAVCRGHVGLWVDWDGSRGTACLREKQGSGIYVLEMINANPYPIIIQGMSVPFRQWLALLNVLCGNFPGTWPFDLKVFLNMLDEMWCPVSTGGEAAEWIFPTVVN